MVENAKNWRMSFSMDKELGERIAQLRKDDRFMRLSYSEIIRILLTAGLEVIADKTQSA